MKRLTVAAAVLALALVLGLPGVVGSTTETQLQSRVAAINATGVYVAELAAFERSWFSSRARIEVGLAPQYGSTLGPLATAPGPAAMLAQRLALVLDIAHGPIAIADGIHLGWSHAVAHVAPETPWLAGLEQLLGIPYLFEFRSATGLLGGLTFEADVPPIDAPILGTARLAFSGLKMSGSQRDRHLVADGGFESLGVAASFGSVNLTRVTVAMDQVLTGDAAFAVGSADFGIERVTAIEAAAAEPLFDVAGLKFVSTSVLDAGGTLLDASATYTVDSIRAMAVNLTAAELGVALRQVDIAAMQAFAGTLQAYVETVQAGLGSAPPFGTEEAGVLHRLLAPGLSIAIEPVRFRYNGQPFDARAKVAVNAARLPPLAAFDVRDLAVWQNALELEAVVDVAKPLAQQLASLAVAQQMAADPTIDPQQRQYLAEAQAGLMLVALVGQGIVSDTGTSYRTELRATNGAITVNGNPVPLGLP